jgi:hypothetical protein
MITPTLADAAIVPTPALEYSISDCIFIYQVLPAIKASCPAETSLSSV